MKKLSFALALIFPTIAAMAAEQPVFTQDKALTKLYDAELYAVSLKPSGACYEFTAIDVIYKKDVNGIVCSDGIRIK